MLHYLSNLSTPATLSCPIFYKNSESWNASFDPLLVHALRISAGTKYSHRGELAVRKPNSGAALQLSGWEHFCENNSKFLNVTPNFFK